MKHAGWAAATALTAISVGAVAFSVVTSPASEAVRLDVASMNWPAVARDGKPIPAVQLPSAALYVLPTCPHCAAAVDRFIAETRIRGVSGLVVAGSEPAEAREYQLRLRLKQSIAVDSRRDFARSAGIEWVPTLILFSADSTARVFPIPAPALVARYLSRWR